MPDDFFRARPQRSELHRFLAEAHLEGMIADVRETHAEVSAKTEAFLEKTASTLHIGHLKAEPATELPVAAVPAPIRLHIPHDPTVCRLSRRVHIDHERQQTSVSPVPQIALQKAASADLLLSETFLTPAAILAAPAPPVALPRAPRLRRAPVLPVVVINAPAKTTRRQAMRALPILIPAFSAVRSRVAVHHAIPVVERRLPSTRRMQRGIVPGLAVAGKGRRMPAAHIPASILAPLSTVRRKKAKVFVIRVLKKRLPARTRLLPLKLAAPAVLLPVTRRMPMLPIPLLKPFLQARRRSTLLRVPPSRSRVLAAKAQAPLAIPLLEPKVTQRQLPVQITRKARSQALPVTRTVAPSKPEAAIPAAKPSAEESAAAFREITACIRAQVKALSRFRKAAAPKVELAIPQAPHAHTESLKHRFGFARRPQVAKAPKPVRQRGFLHEAARFVITSAAIFAISFSVMNAQALGQLLMARLNPEEAAVKKIALEKVVDQEVKNLAPILPTAGMKRESHKVYPPLRIKPAPLENRIVIPKIGKNIPIVGVGGDSLVRSDWGQLEKDIQNALKDGVVHYPGTAEPGQLGNVFVTGHSSYYLWDGGRFKDVFARLHDLDVGDEFTIFWEQNVYRYKIRERKVVSPEETSVLKQPQDQKIATLMTCTPIGTAKNRLILVAEQL